MQQNNQPPKFVIPFAQNDPAKAVIPATSPDDTRASQALGFPPRTGLPPEAGGVPPQKADMNGALNQLAGPILWALAGGRFPFDNAFASDTNVGGYPLGADLLAADARGSWISTANDNTANPDTAGTGWVPGYHYGATALAGQTGGNVTMTPAQAAKRVITITGALTSNLVLIVPAWVYSWTFYNNTSGAFSVSVRTVAGSAAAIPQNGAPTPVNCDGTNCSVLAANVAPATSGTQAARLDQMGGRLLNIRRYTASSTYTPTAGTRWIVVELLGGGGGGGGAVTTTANQVCVGSGGGGGAFVRLRFDFVPSSAAVVVGAGGAGGLPGPSGSTGQNGAASGFDTASVEGGLGGKQYVGSISALPFSVDGGRGGLAIEGGGGALLGQSNGGRGGFGTTSGGPTSYVGAFGGDGGSSAQGLNGLVETVTLPAQNTGVGGAGASNGPSAAGRSGGYGAAGVVIVYEYA